MSIVSSLNCELIHSFIQHILSKCVSSTVVGTVDITVNTTSIIPAQQGLYPRKKESKIENLLLNESVTSPDVHWQN